MTIDVVKNIRLLNIVELVFAADKTGGGEASVRQMFEKYRIVDESRYHNNLPPGLSVQHIIELAKIRNASGHYTQLFEPIQKLLTGARFECFLLAFKKPSPPIMFFRSVCRPILFRLKQGRGRRHHYIPRLSSGFVSHLAHDV